MGYLKAYEFLRINKSINEELKLSKDIRILSFNPYRNYRCKTLHIGVYDKGLVEDFFVNPRKNIKIKSNYLTNEDKVLLSNYLYIYGNDLLDYQLYRINLDELNKRKENRNESI